MYMIAFWVPIFIVVGITYNKYQHNSALFYNAKSMALLAAFGVPIYPLFVFTLAGFYGAQGHEGEAGLARMFYSGVIYYALILFCMFPYTAKTRFKKLAITGIFLNALPAIFCLTVASMLDGFNPR